MNILLVISGKPSQKFLVELSTGSLIKEVISKVAKRQHSEAIVTALSKGRIMGHYFGDGTPDVSADMLLTEENCQWDLMP